MAMVWRWWCVLLPNRKKHRDLFKLTRVTTLLATCTCAWMGDCFVFQSLAGQKITAVCEGCLALVPSLSPAASTHSPALPASASSLARSLSLSLRRNNSIQTRFSWVQFYYDFDVGKVIPSNGTSSSLSSRSQLYLTPQHHFPTSLPLCVGIRPTSTF